MWDFKSKLLFTVNLILIKKKKGKDQSVVQVISISELLFELLHNAKL